jgi:Arc/MetJ-type ribon-helix-helix transcriptional regulator
MENLTTITLPENLYERVKAKVKEGNYLTIADFVEEAIRFRLESLNG